MKKRDVKVPELVRQKLATRGVEGTQWLDALPDLVAELEQEWGLSVGTSLEGGTEAFVAPAITSDGAKAILKLAVPPTEGNTVLANEVTALNLASGRGYARLLRSDLNRRALLLEQLGTPLSKLGYPWQTQTEIICATLRESWVAVPSDYRLTNQDTMAQWFIEFISGLWEELGRPCSQQVVELALSFAGARGRAFEPEKAVLVHGDAHSGNTLQSLTPTSNLPSSFKLIDPDGIVGEPAYDLGVLMREWLNELEPDPVRLGRERCGYLSQLTGADSQAIWQWGYIQSVATGLLVLKIGLEHFGSQLLNIAEAWSSDRN